MGMYIYIKEVAILHRQISIVAKKYGSALGFVILLRHGEIKQDIRNRDLHQNMLSYH